MEHENKKLLVAGSLWTYKEVTYCVDIGIDSPEGNGDTGYLVKDPSDAGWYEALVYHNADQVAPEHYFVRQVDDFLNKFQPVAQEEKVEAQNGE